jgi:hypothetical protein
LLGLPGGRLGLFSWLGIILDIWGGTLALLGRGFTCARIIL